MLVKAYFKNHAPVDYEANRFSMFLLRTDPNVVCVVNAETGEVVHDASCETLYDLPDNM